MGAFNVLARVIDWFPRQFSRGLKLTEIITVLMAPLTFWQAIVYLYEHSETFWLVAPALLSVALGSALAFILAVLFIKSYRMFAQRHVKSRTHPIEQHLIPRCSQAVEKGNLVITHHANSCNPAHQPVMLGTFIHQTDHKVRPICYEAMKRPMQDLLDKVCLLGREVSVTTALVQSMVSKADAANLRHHGNS